MQLSTIKIHNVLQSGHAESQITIDDDYNVPDFRPDLVKLIRQHGSIKIEEVKPTAGAVWIKGKLHFTVLYRSEEENGKISCLKGELPFQEKMNVEGVGEYDPVRVQCVLEDLTIGVIHSRKINVRAVMVLKAEVTTSTVEEYTDGVLAESDVILLHSPTEVTSQILAKRDMCRQRNEIVLPTSKPNIREILWKSVELRNVSSKLDADGIHLSGEIQVMILYQEEEELERIQWYETTIPLDCSTDFEMELTSKEDLFYKIELEEVGKELEVKPDYDGEERMLVLELAIQLFVRVWQESKITLLEDLYSLKQELTPERETVSAEHLLMKNDAVCRMVEPLELMDNQEKILQICSCEGSAHVENVTRQTEGVFVEGTLLVQLLYITTDDQMPVGSVEKIYPFEQLIEIPNAKESMHLEWDCNLLQLSASMQDQTHAEIKASIGIGILAFEVQKINKVTSVREEPFDLMEMQKMPGLVGYIAKSGDTLWNVAKRYHTTREVIMQQNGKKEDSLKAGEKLLIVKEI